jgi:hypothetical protein
MRKSVLLSLTVVALVLVSVPPVSVAQPYDPPAGLSGWVHGLPGGDEEACGGKMTRAGPLEEVRDFRCELWMGTTDPRFTGRYVLMSNHDTYHEVAGALEGGRLTVSSVIRRVENDVGAWIAAPKVTARWVAEADDDGNVGQSEQTIPIEPITFFGEGDYEGLTAIVWLDPITVDSQIWGVIFEGEPPPAPTESG